MASMADRVDRETLERMLDWTKDYPGFEPDHAVDSLFVAERYMGADAYTDKEALFWLAIDVTYWYWVDDRTDQSLHQDVGNVNWISLFQDLQEGVERGSTPEAEYVVRLARALRARSETEADYAWWFKTMLATLAAFRSGEQISRARSMPALVEYLEVGSWSSTVRNILATASILFRMKWASRRADSTLADMERYLGLIARLENDAYGFEKERREGCFANAVLLMEQFTPTAKDFIDRQRIAYEELLLSRVEMLPPDDSFRRFTGNVLSSHRAWYQMRPERYNGST